MAINFKYKDYIGNVAIIIYFRLKNMVDTQIHFHIIKKSLYDCMV